MYMSRKRTCCVRPPWDRAATMCQPCRVAPCCCSCKVARADHRLDGWHLSITSSLRGAKGWHVRVVLCACAVCCVLCAVCCVHVRVCVWWCAGVLACWHAGVLASCGLLSCTLQPNCLVPTFAATDHLVCTSVDHQPWYSSPTSTPYLFLT